MHCPDRNPPSGQLSVEPLKASGQTVMENLVFSLQPHEKNFNLPQQVSLPLTGKEMIDCLSWGFPGKGLVKYVDSTFLQASFSPPSTPKVAAKADPSTTMWSRMKNEGYRLRPASNSPETIGMRERLIGISLLFSAERKW